MSGRSARAAAVSLAALLIAFPAVAEPTKSPAQADSAAKAQAGAAGKSAFAAGVKSYEAGKLQPAVDQLSEALRVGGLAGPDMARALYVRGLAYKKQNKPGLAISDLTSALWLKNGLSESDRQSATAERAEAYRLAGLGSGTSISESGVATEAQQPRPAPAPALAPPPAAVPLTAEPSPLTLVDPAAPKAVTRQDANSVAAREAAEARRLAAMPIDDSSITSSFATTASDKPAQPQTLAAAAPSAQPATPAVEQPQLTAAPADSTAATAPSTGGLSAPSSVSNFFSNLFGGGSQTPPAADAGAPATTASTSPLDAGAGTATSGWQQAANDPAPTAAPAVVAAAPAPAPKPAAKPVAAPTGKYKLHIAAVRSRAEAEAVAQKLTQSVGGALSSRQPTVDEAVIGSMGTFYRVRVGGYANPEEPRGVCNKIRTSGFDCLVVTN
ncbi:MAG: SPOR domain-containing protein [Hyphomicrobium sp.]